MQQRPANVPENATWEADDNEWCLPEKDSDGEYHGIVKWWRPDGTLACETNYVHGTAQGSYCRFHENGEVSRKGNFEGGKLHGTDRFFRSSGETTENFPRGLGPEVSRAEMDYEMGRVGAARCYDANDKQCMENGEPFPESRPDNVPAEAHFRKRDADGEYRWVHGTVVDNLDGTISRVGIWRWWSPDGVLVSEEPYDGGELNGVAKTFDEDDGKLTEEVTWSKGDREGPSRTFEEGALVSEVTYRDGDKRGPQIRQLDEDDRGDGPVTTVRGTYEDDDPIGVIEYLDAEGNVVGSVNTGRISSLEAIEQVLSLEDNILAAANALSAEEQFGPALFALARAVGRGEADVGRLQAEVDRLTPPTSDQMRYGLAQRGRMIVSNVQRFGGGPDKCTRVIFDYIREGAAGWSLLRSAAATLDDMGESAIAAEVIDAAVAGAPADVAATFQFTRGLIRASVGDAPGARDAVNALAKTEADLSKRLGCYINALFPRWDFWPASDSRRAGAKTLAPLLERTTAKSTPDLEPIQLAIEKSATRLAHYRRRLISVFGEQPWIVPDVSHVLRAGEVDVPIPDRFQGVGLQHLCRQEWAHLTWLCHLAGRSEIAMPTEVNAPDDYVQLHMIGWARYFLAYDAEPEERIAAMLKDSDVAKEANHAAILETTMKSAAESDWFGNPMSETDQLLDVDFLHKDENTFINTLRFFADTDVDLFDERDDDEDDDDYDE